MLKEQKRNDAHGSVFRALFVFVFLNGNKDLEAWDTCGCGAQTT